MAASFSSKSSARGRSNRYSRFRRKGEMSEINVTPFVDVLLVLLVIFMVAAPLMTVGVNVDLPEATAAAINQSEEPLVVTVDKDGVLYIQETRVERDQFTQRLKDITKNKLDTRIYVRGDKTLAYGSIMNTMGLLNHAGFHKVALIAELPK